MSDVVTVVLAAGKGERIGGPKALLAWPLREPSGQEVPFAIAHAQTRLDAESTRVVIVTRESFVPPLLWYLKPGIRIVSSHAPDALGPAGSIAAAVQHIDPTDRVLIVPVDTPPARPDTVQRLLDRLECGHPLPLVVRPGYGGKAGHPVAATAAALARYREPDPPPLRDHIRSLGERGVIEEVDDSSVLVDMDTPADLFRLLGRPPRFLPPGCP